MNRKNLTILVGLVVVILTFVFSGVLMSPRSDDDKVQNESTEVASSPKQSVLNIPKVESVPEDTVQDSAPHSKFTHFQVGNRNVKSIFADGDVVWIGTSGGVVRYDTLTDEHRLYSVRNGLLANGVFHVSRIQGRIAVGTYGGGLSMLNEETGEWQTYNVPEGLGDAFVYDVLEMKNGDIWIATWTGVNRIVGGRLDDPDAWEIYTVANTQGGVPNDWVYALAEGINGELWMATEGGLALFSDNIWQNWQHSDGLGAEYDLVKAQNPFKNDPAKYSEHHARQKIEQGLQNVDTAYNPNYIVALDVDQQGNVWAGTWGAGLSRFDGKSWTTYTVSDGLPANHIFMAHVDKDNTVWIGTSNGVAEMNVEGKVKRLLSTRDGLFSNTVFSMTSQEDGSKWIGSFGGIAHLKNL